MALSATHSEKGEPAEVFGVGDSVRVHQKIEEGEKTRVQVFEGMVTNIKGRQELKTFTVRRIGSQQIGIERIFPLFAPTIQKIEVVRKGTRGTRRAKLAYTRDKSKREIEKIYSRAAKREEAKTKKKTKTTPKKKKAATKNKKKK